MNRFERWFCATPLWRFLTERQLLPWILSGAELGDHVLEIGAGAGAATYGLRRCVPRVTSLEYDYPSAAVLSARRNNSRSGVLQGDAAQLPFATGSFSSAIAVLVLHHLESDEAQNRTFSEVFRVLKPGGRFYALEIHDGWVQRAVHRSSRFVAVSPASVPARLAAAGFSTVTVDVRRGGFKFCAARAEVGSVHSIVVKNADLGVVSADHQRSNATP